MAAERPRFTLHFTRTYASWLNQVERWFALMGIVFSSCTSGTAGKTRTLAFYTSARSMAFAMISIGPFLNGSIQCWKPSP